MEEAYNEEIIVSFIESYLQLDEQQEKVYQRRLENKNILQGVEIIKSKFRLEGEAKGLIKSIDVILNARSIILDGNLKRQISKLSVSQLETLIRAAIAFEKPKNMDNWLRQHGQKQDTSSLKGSESQNIEPLLLD